MATQYKVISLNDEKIWPQALQWPKGQREELVANLEELLNSMSLEGWELIGPCPIGTVYTMIFRREGKP